MRKKKRCNEATKIGLAVDKVLWERFKKVAKKSVPRVSLTALLEAALAEYLGEYLGSSGSESENSFRVPDP